MKIIGKTSSGKPIYAAFQFHRSFDDWMVNDHVDAAEVHRKAVRTDIKTNVSMHENSAALHDEAAQRIRRLVEKLGLTRSGVRSARSHSRKKSPAQLDRDIAEVLRRSSRSHATRARALPLDSRLPLNR